jgi:hypothetical protein
MRNVPKIVGVDVESDYRIAARREFRSVHGLEDPFVAARFDGHKQNTLAIVKLVGDC